MMEMGVPPMFVMNINMPNYPPGNPVWGAKREDGPNFSLVLYMRVNYVGYRAMKERSPAGKLLKVCCPPRTARCRQRACRSILWTTYKTLPSRIVSSAFRVCAPSLKSSCLRCWRATMASPS